MKSPLYKPRPEHWPRFNLRWLLALFMLAPFLLAPVVESYQEWRESTQTALDSFRVANWQRWSRATMQEENTHGRHVLVVFTADWDVSVHWSEDATDTPAFRRQLWKNGITPLRADWSIPENSPEITEELQRLGCDSIPLFVLYPASGGKPVVVSNANRYVTADALASAIRNLKE